jgi:hypothetical protein
MTPISDLAILLQTMQPELHPGTYAFATLHRDQSVLLTDLVALVHETEGTSVVVHEDDLERLGLTAVFLCSWITLSVNSALHAVGLTAAVSSALSDAGISCNVIAGTHHDHLFVSVSDAAAALHAMQALQQRAAAPLDA